MIVVGALMLRRKDARDVDTSLETFPDATLRSLPLLVGTAFLVGVLSGFFGVGGGFLIVPGLLFATGMPMICAIGSSLLAVGAFGLTTSIIYGLSGLMDWTVAGEYLIGGFAGGIMGVTLAAQCASHKATLSRVFAGLVFAVALYIIYRTAADLRLFSNRSLAKHRVRDRGAAGSRAASLVALGSS